MKSVPSSSGQYQIFLPFFLSSSLSLFLVFYSLLFFFFHLPKLIHITVNASQSGCAAPSSRTGDAPTQRQGQMSLWLSPNPSFLWQYLSLCPGARQGTILFCTTAAHHTSLALLWTPSPGGQQDSGMGTGHPRSPGPLCLSSKAHLIPAWKERKTLLGCCGQAAAPARA